MHLLPTNPNETSILVVNDTKEQTDQEATKRKYRPFWHRWDVKLALLAAVVAIVAPFGPTWCRNTISTTPGRQPPVTRPRIQILHPMSSAGVFALDYTQHPPTMSLEGTCIAPLGEGECILIAVKSNVLEETWRAQHHLGLILLDAQGGWRADGILVGRKTDSADRIANSRFEFAAAIVTTELRDLLERDESRIYKPSMPFAKTRPLAPNKNGEP